MGRFSCMVRRFGRCQTMLFKLVDVSKELTAICKSLPCVQEELAKKAEQLPVFLKKKALKPCELTDGDEQEIAQFLKEAEECLKKAKEYSAERKGYWDEVRLKTTGR